MKAFTSLLISLLLIASGPSDAAVEGYSFNASRFAKQSAPVAKTDAIDYESIKHHTRHRKYHSALSVTRNVSNVTIQFHTKQELTDLRGRNVNGFSKVRRDGTCEIHVMMPYNWNDDDAMRTVGHELMHCFGAVHEKGEHKHEKHTPKATPALHRVAEKSQPAAKTTSTGYRMASSYTSLKKYKMPALVEKQRGLSSHF